jgi:hypothetical protein
VLEVFLQYGPVGTILSTTERWIDNYRKLGQGLPKILFLKYSGDAVNMSAGGGPYLENNLWSATQLCANLAHRALTYQGFTKDRIRYLSSDADLDLDDNGEPDDVIEATRANLEKAVTVWARDAEALTVYLVDHGGVGNFLVNGTETVTASELDAWLDEAQGAIPGRVTVIYDACHAGSFIPILTPPDKRDRVVITSTTDVEEAYFITKGSISFSSFFWTHIFNGASIKKAFDLTVEAIGYCEETQHPRLEANGNGISNGEGDFALIRNSYIGNGTAIDGDVPVIGKVSEEQFITETPSAVLDASEVTDSDGIARVWAVIRPPDYRQGISSVIELPSIDLSPSEDDRYEGTYNGFHAEGTYYIAIYAKDRLGNTSAPKLTKVSVENPLRRRAVIVAGQSDLFWPAIENNADLVYRALRFQGYTDQDIYFLSAVTFSEGVDGLASLSNLQFAIKDWARDNTQDLVLYMTGEGKKGKFSLNDEETLAAKRLDRWLDQLQEDIPGKVTVIYDACRSGSFLEVLTPPEGRERILLSSTHADDAAFFLSDGDVSFSAFFWKRVLNGASVLDAFVHAKKAIAFSCDTQLPQLDDNGNGIGNEKLDGQLAQYYTIGVGIMLAADDPMIGSVVPDQTLREGNSATIWVDGVATTGSIRRVWAVMTPPGFQSKRANMAVTDMPTAELTSAGGGRYEGSYGGFSEPGTYEIAVYAMDDEGNVSIPKKTRIQKVFPPDSFEEDDTAALANVIVVNDPAPQRHCFHDGADEDWVKFFAIAGRTYSVEALNLEAACDVVIGFYDKDGTLLFETDEGGAGEEEFDDWECPKEGEGDYYIRFRHFDPKVFGKKTGYNVRIHRPISPISGDISGVIMDDAGGPIRDVHVVTSGGGSAISLSDGSYLMLGHDAGTFTITAAAFGYVTVSSTVALPEAAHEVKNFRLVRDDLDSDQDGMPDYWETAFGLEPHRNDAGEDLDQDGITNWGEFNVGSNPRNKRPDPPALFSPGHSDDCEAGVSLTPELEIEGFHDSEGDTHAYTEWEISSESGVAFSTKSNRHLTSLPVPVFVLERETSYLWRARCYDGGGASDWSDGFQFATDDDPAVLDDGIPSEQKVTDPGVDLDHDGTPDMNQGDMKCVNTVVGAGQIAMKFGPGIDVERMESVDPDCLADASDKPDCMPLGAISFRLKVPQPGDTVQVTVHLSEPAPSDARWYKHTPAHGWEVYSNTTFRDDNRRMVDLVLKDGDPDCGDADGVENGYIVDPSGIGITDASDQGQGGGSIVIGGSSSGGGGGCYISTAVSGFLPPLPWVWFFFIAALVVGLRVNFSRKV